MKPSIEKIPEFYRPYILEIKEEDVVKALWNQKEETIKLFSGISEEKGLFAYAEGKWSIKEILGHITDAERVFAYRALCFARNETIALPGFDENSYVAAANFNKRTVPSLLSEYMAVRLSSFALFESFSPSDLEKTGTANGKTFAVNTLGYIMLGHEKHHLRILKERYLVG